MGGSGSGRYSGYSFRSTTEDYRSIDVRRWAREGLLEPGQWFGWQWSVEGEQIASIKAAAEAYAVRLVYRSRSYGEDWQEMDYRVGLDWTPCNFGGSRQWFMCPAKGCGRRAAVLYGGAIFACRRCHGLTYACQREDALSRMMRKTQKLESRLGWKHGFGGKPKGMHWRTFDALVSEHDRLENAQLGQLERRFGRYGFNLDKIL